MGGNKRLEIQKGVITFSDKGRCDKGENVQRNTGSQEGMPKKRISRSYGYSFLKCCSDQIEWGMKTGISRLFYKCFITISGITGAFMSNLFKGWWPYCGNDLTMWARLVS